MRAGETLRRESAAWGCEGEAKGRPEGWCLSAFVTALRSSVQTRKLYFTSMTELLRVAPHIFS